MKPYFPIRAYHSGLDDELHGEVIHVEEFASPKHEKENTHDVPHKAKKYSALLSQYWPKNSRSSQNAAGPEGSR